MIVKGEPCGKDYRGRQIIGAACPFCGHFQAEMERGCKHLVAVYPQYLEFVFEN